MSTLLKENVKSADLMGVGYYYKQDQPDGYCWLQVEGGGPLWDVTIESHKQIEKCYEIEMSLIKNGIHEFKTLSQFQRHTKLLCEDLIKQFQIMAGYPNGKPMSEPLMNIEIDNKMLQLIVKINIQIYYMTQWETIPNDEYNGMNYVYKNIQMK